MTEQEWLAGEDPFELFTCVRYDELWRKRQLYCLAVWDSVRELWEEDKYSCEGMAFLTENAESFDWHDDEHPKDEDADCAITDIDGELVNRFWNHIVAGDDELWDAIHTRTEARLTDWEDADCLRAGAAFTVVAEALYDGWVRSLYEVRPQLTASRLAVRIAANAERAKESALKVWRTELAKYAALVREVFFFPFRTPTIHPSWLAWNNGTVVKLAQVIYDDQAFDRLPILADALEEAGCTDADILAHCRQRGTHVRGCWAVDFILGKG